MRPILWSPTPLDLPASGSGSEHCEARMLEFQLLEALKLTTCNRLFRGTLHRRQLFPISYGNAKAVILINETSRAGGYGWPIKKCQKRRRTYGRLLLMKWISLVIAVILLGVFGASPTHAHSGHAHATPADRLAVSVGPTASSLPGDSIADQAGQVRGTAERSPLQASNLQLEAWVCRHCRGECETSCDACMAADIGCGACTACCCAGLAGVLTSSLALQLESTGKRHGNRSGPALADNSIRPEPPPPKS